MSRTQTAGRKPSSVDRALARDRLGVPAVLAFILASVAPLTVASGATLNTSGGLQSNAVRRG